MDYIPYTYRLFHKPTKKYYYGCKTSKHGKNIANPNTFWLSYFTSSVEVKKLIEEYGKDSFDFKITRVFKTKEQTVAWEHKFLVRVDAMRNPNFLNKSNGKTTFYAKDLVSDSTREKLRVIGKNRTYSPETIEKFSKSKKGENHPFFGKRRSEETKQKMREKALGRKHSEETRKKIAEKQTGRPRTTETKEKLRIAFTGANSPCFGKPCSLETKEKIRQKALERHALKLNK